MTKEEIEERMAECPFKEGKYCHMYNDTVLECTGACSFVVDYPRLKELYAKNLGEHTVLA